MWKVWKNSGGGGIKCKFDFCHLLSTMHYAVYCLLFEIKLFTNVFLNIHKENKTQAIRVEELFITHND